MRRTVGIAAGIIGAALIATAAVSCDDSTGPGGDEFIAILSPANEVPPKTSAGTGVTRFDDDGDVIEWTLELTNMTGVTASHIHLGAAGTAPASNIIFNLFIPNGTTGTVNGVVAQGTITSANNPNVSLDSLRTLFNNGMAYVNVHTTANPGGEIRDQVRPDN
jgi:CHRD domain-containing protein